MLYGKRHLKFKFKNEWVERIRKINHTPQLAVRKINPQRNGSWDTDILQGESSVHEEGMPVTNTAHWEACQLQT